MRWEVDEQTLDWDWAAERLGQALSASAFRNVGDAFRFSERRIDEIAECISSAPEYSELHDAGVAWMVTGSLGRMEALSASDVDLTLILPDGLSLDEVRGADLAIRERIRASLQVHVSAGENFTSPFSVSDVASVDRIGGNLDNVNTLTKRMLLLTESQCVLGKDIYPGFRDAAFNAYVRSPTTRRRYLIGLAYDTIRFYRTLAADYKSRVEWEEKPWAIRYIKLRSSRKFWFLSTMFALLSSVTRHETLPSETVSHALALLRPPPVFRLIYATEKAGIPGQLQAIPYYDYYLKQVGDEGVRHALTKVVHEHRYDSDEFRKLKFNADRLRRAMVETVEALPPNWRRHMMHLFLL